MLAEAYEFVCPLDDVQHVFHRCDGAELRGFFLPVFHAGAAGEQFAFAVDEGLELFFDGESFALDVLCLNSLVYQEDFYGVVFFERGVCEAEGVPDFFRVVRAQYDAYFQ